MRIAVIGGGISGLTAAYRLGRRFDVTVYESRQRIGGHTHTVSVQEAGLELAIDTGFIVYNERNYPRFIRLLDELAVETQPSVMSFGIRNHSTGLEYSGSLPWGLFAQPVNALKPGYWRFLAEIQRFGKLGLAERERRSSQTLGDFLGQHQFSERFRNDYLLPMASAIWSSSHAGIELFPLKTFLEFFANHGLLDLRNRPQWRVIKGGSHSYVRAMLSADRFSVRTSSPVERVLRSSKGADVMTPNGESERFDAVVFACHSDQVLKIIDEPSDQERSILGAIRYANNDVVLHTDETLLPRAGRARAAWNYWTDGADANCLPAVTYSMNTLQSLTTEKHYLVTLNRTDAIDSAHVIARYQYAHPQFDQAAVGAQARWSEISGRERSSVFCGAYWGYGFHEDGVVSGERAAAAVEAMND